MSTPEQGALRKARAVVGVRWLGTLALGAFLLTRNDLGPASAIVSDAAPRWIVLAVVLYFADRCAASAKWRLLVSVEGRGIPFWTALSIYLQSSFLGAALPATVGTDLVRARMAQPYAGNFTNSLSAVIVERLAGVVALVALCSDRASVVCSNFLFASGRYPGPLGSRRHSFADRGSVDDLEVPAFGNRRTEHSPGWPGKAICQPIGRQLGRVSRASEARCHRSGDCVRATIPLHADQLAAGRGPGNRCPAEHHAVGVAHRDDGDPAPDLGARLRSQRECC